jgi:hypothetical protein
MTSRRRPTLEFRDGRAPARRRSRLPGRRAGITGRRRDLHTMDPCPRAEGSFEDGTGMERPVRVAVGPDDERGTCADDVRDGQPGWACPASRLLATDAADLQ